MAELKFLSVSDVIALHEQVMAASNQQATSLVRPEALESAVHSARNLAWYNGAIAPEISVHLAIHVALAHPWVDGNKRTAATAGVLLARLNGARPPSAAESLEFAKHLIRYIETSHDGREAVFAEFVKLVDLWFV